MNAGYFDPIHDILRSLSLVRSLLKGQFRARGTKGLNKKHYFAYFYQFLSRDSEHSTSHGTGFVFFERSAQPVHFVENRAVRKVVRNQPEILRVGLVTPKFLDRLALNRFQYSQAPL